MDNAWIETLDTPTFEEIVDKLGYDVLDLILEDSAMEDDEFESGPIFNRVKNSFYYIVLIRI